MGIALFFRLLQMLRKRQNKRILNKIVEEVARVTTVTTATYVLSKISGKNEHRYTHNVQIPCLLSEMPALGLCRRGHSVTDQKVCQCICFLINTYVDVRDTRMSATVALCQAHSFSPSRHCNLAHSQQTWQLLTLSTRHSAPWALAKARNVCSNSRHVTPDSTF